MIMRFAAGLFLTISSQEQTAFSCTVCLHVSKRFAKTDIKANFVRFFKLPTIFLLIIFRYGDKDPKSPLRGDMNIAIQGSHPVTDVF